jgi:glycosyltransferase involved in cell wall biosynthesis
VPSRAAREISFALSSLQREFAYDLIEMEETWGVARYVRRTPRVPMIVRIHGPWFLNGPVLGIAKDKAFEYRVRQERLAISGADGITAPSLDVLERVRREYDLALPDAEVIPPPGPVVPETRRWNWADCDRDSILFVGRFDRHKGGDLAIDAFREVARERPSARLWFVGPDRGLLDEDGRTLDLVTYIREHLPNDDLRNRVQVLGHRGPDEIVELRRRAFVTIVPSRYETFGIIVLEAFAFGSPLIVSDAGSLPELVRPGETALTFRSGDYRDLASKILQMLKNPDLAQKMSACARADYEARFTPSVIASRMAAFYDRVLARANTGLTCPG